MRGRGWIITCALLLALAMFFKFALIGYSFTALTLALVAALVCAFHLLGRCRSRVPRRVLAVLTALGLAAFAALEAPVISAASGTDGGGADCIIVLGAGVNGTVPSLSLRERLEAAESYLRDNPDCTAIVSGGQGEGEDITEAQAMRDWLVSRGIDEKRIIMEVRAASTEENLRYSFDILRERGCEPEKMHIAVVSSEYHLCRAARLAKSLGVAVTTVPARTEYPVLRLNYFIREGFAAAYLLLLG